MIMVGFNRRFAPHAEKIRNLLSGSKGPKFMQMTVNAGFIPQSHWTQDPKIGGGRLIGEGCHFFDLLVSIAQAPIIEVSASQPGGADSFSVILKFADSSQGTINYFTNGSKSFPKEQLEVFCDGKILFLDNFKKLTGSGFKLFRKMGLFKMDKGHREEIRQFVSSIEDGKPSPIPFDQIVNVSRAVFAAVLSIREGKTEKV
jgi:predicted dehydrogenase